MKNLASMNIYPRATKGSHFQNVRTLPRTIKGPKATVEASMHGLASTETLFNWQIPQLAVLTKLIPQTKCFIVKMDGINFMVKNISIKTRSLTIGDFVAISKTANGQNLQSGGVTQKAKNGGKQTLPMVQPQFSQSEWFSLR